jgi:DNA-binding NtrC family response regulator
MDVASIKRRFGIIGNTPGLNRAISVAAQVAATDISVLILGESGVGKESMPRIIHNFSTRKHGAYIAVNCGAIPEGTIDSELFGHEKGAFTGATESRKGYFEEANGGTIFLDEVAELPLTTQVRLLRVLETGEFIRVGSSKVQKTDVRVVAATNVDFDRAISEGRFREDLYYRLSQVPIQMPALRERGPDIHLLFRKFTTDFSERYRMPPIRLSPDAQEVLENYPWPGNIRQLKNTAEQISILEEDREVDADRLLTYLPETHRSRLPVRLADAAGASETMNEREILYKVLFDMRSELHDLKQLVLGMVANGGDVRKEDEDLVTRLYAMEEGSRYLPPERQLSERSGSWQRPYVHEEEPSDAEEIEEVLSLQDTEKELIRKALEKHNNRRKNAADELGISERTLYRKIKEYGLK